MKQTTSREAQQIESEGKNLYTIEIFTPRGKDTVGRPTYRFPTREQAEQYRDEHHPKGKVREKKGLPVGQSVSYEDGDFQFEGDE